MFLPAITGPIWKHLQRIRYDRTPINVFIRGPDWCFLTGGCTVLEGLALRIVPSVEQADSAIFCSRVSHILHQVHSRRLAHTQMDPEQQQRAVFPLEMQSDFGAQGLRLERSKLVCTYCTPHMWREPHSVWAVYAYAAAQ